MATITAKTFPGVYTTIIDRSEIPPTTSRFACGLIGIASKGPFNTPTQVRSYKEFITTFGNPISTTFDNNTGLPVGTGFFLADAVSVLANLTDGIFVCRVGNQYTNVAGASVSGVGSSRTFVVSPSSAASQLTTGNYVRLQEGGKASTVNAQITTISNGTVTLSTTTDTLQAGYVAATLDYNVFAGAANKAEGVLSAYTYGATANGTIDSVISTVGTITGVKNNFQFTVQQNPSNVGVGNVYKIKQTGKITTSEVRVKAIAGNTILLETADLTRQGYQALPLQDSYDSAQLYQATGSVPFLYLQATTEGDWANGADAPHGLYVRVRPGSAPGTKKFEVFVNNGLVETIDNLSDDPAQVATAANPSNWYVTAINNLSQYIFIKNYNSLGGGQLLHAANTASPWDTQYLTASGSGASQSMPIGAVNAGGTTGGNFKFGYNGADAQESDFVGTVNPTDDTMTGIKSFRDADNFQVDLLAAPMDLSQVGAGVTSGIALMQELRETAKLINALGIVDVPPGLNARQAVDWHNGTGQFTGRGRIDSPNLAVYWNWWTGVGADGVTKILPPTLAALRAMAFTFDNDKPWYAAAGETRGLIPEATSLEFTKVSSDAKSAMYGNSNSVNPILLLRNRIVLYGERTMQRIETKLTAVHSVILVNFVVNNLAVVARRFVFEPNDPELLRLIKLAFSEFLDKVKNERGVEDYVVIVDETNNTPDTRNRREVIVDLQLIPTDAAERIYINATVRESGAQLNSVT